MMTDLSRLRRPHRKSRGGFPDHGCDFPALELGFEISEREKSHAWECAACRDLAAHELLREQDRGHAGNLGAVSCHSMRARLPSSRVPSTLMIMPPRSLPNQFKAWASRLSASTQRSSGTV